MTLGGSWGAGGLVWLLDELLYCVYLTSTVYAIFNLIPIPPLDGSSILRYLAPPLRNILDDLRPYGFTILMILFWVGDAGALLQWPIALVLLFW